MQKTNTTPLEIEQLRRRLKSSKRRGRYAVHRLATLINMIEGWRARPIPSSGAGKISRLNVFPDLEATNDELGIYMAVEVKSSRRNFIYVERPTQILKLFQTMNLFGRYPKRFAVLACHFGKVWRFMILRGFQAKFHYIAVRRHWKKPGIFQSLEELLSILAKDTTVYFTPKPEKPDFS